MSDPYDVLSLLGELSEARKEIKALKRRVAALEASRGRWKGEASAWKWGALAVRRLDKRRGRV